MIGSVYLGKDIRTGREVALKVERHQGSDSDLFHEFKIYKDINGCPEPIGMELRDHTM